MVVRCLAPATMAGMAGIFTSIPQVRLHGGEAGNGCHGCSGPRPSPPRADSGQTAGETQPEHLRRPQEV